MREFKTRKPKTAGVNSHLFGELPTPGANSTVLAQPEEKPASIFLRLSDPKFLRVEKAKTRRNSFSKDLALVLQPPPTDAKV